MDPQAIPEGTVKLDAITATSARREVQQKYPQGATIYGWRDGECVYIGTVRERGNKAPTASVSRNHTKRANEFYAMPLNGGQNG